MPPRAPLPLVIVPILVLVNIKCMVFGHSTHESPRFEFFVTVRAVAEDVEESVTRVKNDTDVAIVRIFGSPECVVDSLSVRHISFHVDCGYAGAEDLAAASFAVVFEVVD